ncbi:MAG: hypothetical protein JNL95_14955 [Chitinophagales bacterium]|nr:hypothetical protein [Chitinophagales bacterium]
MKKLITNFAFLGCYVSAFSQIVLDQSNYPFPLASTPVAEITANVSSIPSRGAAQVWDYSTATPVSPSTNDVTLLSGDPNFPDAQYKLTSLYKGLTSSLGYNFDQYYAITASGANAIGIHVPEQRYGLGALTGNTADSLIILDNIIYYPTDPRPLIAFPASMDSTWSSQRRNVVNMELTVASAGLSKASLQQAFYFLRLDSVIGYGILKLPPQTVFNSDVPVLQVKTLAACRDSFYLGGSPAPSALLSGFGMSQWQQSSPTSFRYNFYREGLNNYQMAVNFSSPLFTNMTTSFISTALPTLPTGITNEDAVGNNWSTYPNPVTENRFSVAMGKHCNVSAVILRDVSGRIIETVVPTNKGNILEVQMNNKLAEGFYWFSLQDDAAKIVSTGKIMVIK